MPSSIKQGSLRRTMRESPQRRRPGRSLDMDQPLRYTLPSHNHDYGHSTAPPLRGDERAYIPSRASFNHSDPVVPTTVGPNPAHDGSVDFEDLPEIKSKKEHPYMTKAQKYRLRLKNHILAMIGEYVGTVLFLFFAFGVITAFSCRELD